MASGRRTIELVAFARGSSFNRATVKRRRPTLADVRRFDRDCCKERRASVSARRIERAARPLCAMRPVDWTPAERRGRVDGDALTDIARMDH